MANSPVTVLVYTQEVEKHLKFDLTRPPGKSMNFGGFFKKKKKNQLFIELIKHAFLIY